MSSSRPRLLFRLSLVAMLLATSAPAFAGGEISVTSGRKWFAADLDEPVYGINVGVLTSFGGDSWPVWAAFDIIANFETDAAPTSTDPYPTSLGSLDIHPGVRKVWEEKNWRVSVGGGPAFHRVAASILGELPTESEDGDGSGVGFWLNARGAVRFGHFQAGLDARLSRASSSFELVRTLWGEELGRRDYKVETGGQSLGFFLGMGW